MNKELGGYIGLDTIPNNSIKTPQQVEQETRQRQELLAELQAKEPHICSGPDCELAWENEILS